MTSSTAVFVKPPQAPPRAAGPAYALVAAFQVTCALLIGHLYAAQQNTLERNGRWIASKALLEQGVMGTLNFLSQPNTLAGEQLNLGAWHGFQEVLYRAPLALEEVACDVRLAENSYLILICNRTPQGFCGIRVSRNPRFPDLFFVARPDGEFTATQPLLPTRKERHGWLHLEGRFHADGFAVSLDGESLGDFSFPVPSPQGFGFRCGLANVAIDNVSLQTVGATQPIEDHFSNVGDLFLASVVAGFGLLLLDAIVLMVSRRPRRRVLLTVASGSLATLLCLSLFTVAHRSVLARRHVAGSREEEERFRRGEVELVTQEIRARTSVTPPSGTLRVLFVGTSQTWGSGATRQEENYVRTVERELATRHGLSTECINAGILALDSAWLLNLYETQWVQLEPNLLVLNLSNNDKDATVFERSLEGFLALNRKHGIPTLLALEANSIEHRPNGPELHSVVRRVAERHGTPMLDLHGQLSAATDRGLLWWDFVHPTSFGHRLLGTALVPPVAQLLQGQEGSSANEIEPLERGSESSLHDNSTTSQ